MDSNGLHERIKAVRKSLTPKVSQTAFAEMLGTSRRAITTYETGVVTPSDTFIQLLCTKFNISEEWLRTGKEPMHKSNIEAQMDTYTRGYALDAEEREIIRYFLKLKPEDRAAMIAHVEHIADAIRSARAEAAEKQQEPAANQASEDKRAHAHRLLDAELDAEEKAASDSTSGNSDARKKA